MEYKLAKQLKDAGFPQKQFSFANKYAAEWPHDIPPEKWPYNPTLQELIEACGEKFWQLNYAMGSPNTWIARGDASNNRGVGATASEAMAKLWLALNKK